MVDDIFRFSPTVAADYSGEWLDESTFVVMILDAANSLTAIGGSSVSLRQDGVDVDGDGVSGDLNSPGSKLLATNSERLISLQHQVQLAGSFGAKNEVVPEYWSEVAQGAHVPGIVQFQFQDLQQATLDATWSVGDSLVIRFDTATNVKAGWPSSGGRDFVDALFEFSSPLGIDYSGEWRSTSTFAVTAVDPLMGNPTLALTSARVLAEVRAEAGTGLSANLNTSAVQMLTGDFGKEVTPVATGFDTVDPDNSELAYGAGDTLTLSFSLPTNRDSASPQRSYVDSLFAFSPQFGDDYSGAWDDDSTFVITVLSVGNNAPELGEATASVRGVVFDSSRQRPQATNTSTVLGGNYGRTDAPQLVSFVADDPTDRDSVFGAGDVLTLGFDMATDRGGRNESTSDKTSIDSLFAFSAPLGGNYTGAWLDGSTFAVTILEAAAEAPVPGVSDVRLINTSYIRNRAATATPKLGVPVELTGDFGSTVPRLNAFTAQGKVWKHLSACPCTPLRGQTRVLSPNPNQPTPGRGAFRGQTRVPSPNSHQPTPGREATTPSTTPETPSLLPSTRRLTALACVAAGCMSIHSSPSRTTSESTTAARGPMRRHSGWSSSTPARMCQSSTACKQRSPETSAIQHERPCPSREAGRW